MHIQVMILCIDKHWSLCQMSQTFPIVKDSDFSIYNCKYYSKTSKDAGASQKKKQGCKRHLCRAWIPSHNWYIYSLSSQSFITHNIVCKDMERKKKKITRFRMWLIIFKMSNQSLNIYLKLQIVSKWFKIISVKSPVVFPSKPAFI